jgi:BirA family transcriptional regulator, biotin operon repressor / biotin---[acetyl-CoA-carboxylase] ligase
VYDLTLLEAALAGSIYTGRLHYAAITGSTNNDAVAAARNGAPHGSVWFAEEQTAGRGRGDHKWVSNAGQGLYVSVLLRPELAAVHLPLLPLVAGLAAAEAIGAASGLTADLRWPNDLLIGPNKTGGILVESKIEGGRAAYTVVGIGINVHQSGFAADLATPATSLDLAAGRTISRQALLIALLKSLEREAVLLAQPAALAGILERVEAASTWMRGRPVDVHGPQACSGVTDGLDANGFLRIRTAQGLTVVQTGGMRAKVMD